MRNTVIGLSAFLVLGGCAGARNQAVIEPATPTAAPSVAAMVPATVQTQVPAGASNALPDRAAIEPVIVPVVAAGTVQPVPAVQAPSAPQSCQTPGRTEPANTVAVQAPIDQPGAGRNTARPESSRTPDPYQCMLAWANNAQQALAPWVVPVQARDVSSQTKR
jgi:hypothetical protein